MLSKPSLMVAISFVSTFLIAAVAQAKVTTGPRGTLHGCVSSTER
jgi:hypothetical protein